MDNPQIQKDKIPHESSIYTEQTWFDRGRSSKCDAFPEVSRSHIIPTRSPQKDVQSSPVAPKPNPKQKLLFVHSSGTAGRNQWRVDRRAINAHVQKEHASKNKKSAAIPRHFRTTHTSTQALVHSGEHQIPVSRLVTGSEEPEIGSQSRRAANSPRRTAVAASRSRTQCPSCGMEVTFELHQHASPANLDNKSSSGGGYIAYPEGRHTAVAPLPPGSKDTGIWLSQLERCASPSPATTPALNPFANAVVPINRRMSINLDYWYNFLTPRAIPNKDMSDCLNGFVTPLAVAEPVAMYALLALSSFHYETVSGGLSSKAIYEAGHSLLPLDQRPDYLIYKQRSISLVNQNMADPVDALSQKTVFAITCLIGLHAHVCGTSNAQLSDFLDIAPHVQGLQKLLSLRGGFYDIPIVAAEQVYVSVYFLAAATKSPPVLQPPPNNLPHPTIPPDLHSRAHRMATALTTRPLVHLLHPSLLAIVHQLSDLMLFQSFSSRSPNPVWISPDFTLTDINYINLSTFHVIHNLLALPYQDPLSLQGTAGKTYIAELQEPLRVSLVLFYYANWRMHDSTSPLFRTLASQLKDSLDAYTDAHRTLFTYSTENPTPPAVHELLVWILCLGAHASAGQKQRPWFVLQATCGIRALGLRAWEELRGLCAGFFYSDEVYAESFRGVWEECELLLARA